MTILKDTKLPDNNTTKQKLAIRNKIIDFMSSPDYAPMKASKLFRVANVAGDKRHQAKNIIADLLDEAVVLSIEKRKLILAEKSELLRGRITFTRSGNAFVKLDDNREIFVPSNASSTALDNDIVLARINRQVKHGDKMMPEGAVVSIVERHSLTIVGTLVKRGGTFYATPMKSRISVDIKVNNPERAELGDRVLVELHEWEKYQDPEGDIIDVIGPADNPALDTIAVMKSYQLEDHFSDRVVKEAETVGIKEADIEKRYDFRDHFVFTIDPETARDFDDAISLEKEGDGWLLGVHVADVSYFVRPGTELDKEAIKRGTSVYLPDKVVPMLPEQLSNGICSLNPNADRMAFSVFLTLDHNFKVKKTEFKETIIHSRLRLTYKQALKILESKDASVFPDWGVSKFHVKLIKQANEIARSFRAKRFKRGALEMHIPEVRFKIGEDGRIAEIIPETTDEAHQLIEEFMLMANESVCYYIESKNIPLIHRVHEEPDPDKLEELAENFMMAGISVGDLTDRFELNDVLQRVADLPQARAWNTAVLRSMKRAMYSHINKGHYGLAKRHYAHFTSPIRRYPDLIVHRILKAQLANDKNAYSKGQLEQLADHCSFRESVAVDAERELITLKKMRYFQEQLDSGKPEALEAIVTEVKRFGLMIEIPAVQVYGMVHISDLRQDNYRYSERSRTMFSNKYELGVGSKLLVIIAKIDAVKNFMDFAPVEILEAKKNSKPKSKFDKKSSSKYDNQGKKKKKGRGSRKQRANKHSGRR